MRFEFFCAACMRACVHACMCVCGACVLVCAIELTLCMRARECA